MKFKCLTILMTLFLCTTIEAQNQCKDVLYDANRLYIAGNLQDAAELLEGCVEKVKNKEQKFETYKLLAMVYQDLNRHEEMNNLIPKLLTLNPTYQKYPNNDALQFTRALSGYEIKPVWFGGIQIGLNVNNPKFVSSYSTIVESKQSYLPYTGYQMGFTAHRILPADLSVGAQLLFSGTGLTHIMEYNEGWRKEYNEQIQMTSVSFNIMKSFKWKVNTAIGLAPGFDRIISSKVNLNTITPSGQILTQNSKNGIDERHGIQPNIGIVGEINFELDRGTLGIRAGYYLYNKNTVDANKREADSEFTYTTQYINDDVKLRIFGMSLIYTLPFSYKIVQLK